MTLHKLVNGVRVDLTEEEEKKVRAEWEENRIKSELKKKERDALRLKKEHVIDKILSGLTEEEKLLIKPNLM